MKRYTEELLGWCFLGLVVSVLVFPMRDWWALFQIPESARAALKEIMPHGTVGRVETIDRPGESLLEFHVRQDRVPYTVRMTPGGQMVGISFPVRMDDLPTDRQREIRERFGQRHIADIRSIWNHGRPKYYEVHVDRNGHIERVRLSADTESDVKVSLGSPTPPNDSLANR
jgi:hypothetical protein